MKISRRNTGILANRAGFTLIEVMIAVAVFSVGMMAVAALELVALNGYASSRDQARSSELAQRVVSLMKVEALNWGVSGDAGVDNLDSIYAATSDSPFGANAILKDIAQNEWQWQVITEAPVDEMLEQGDGTHGRYCVYARGGYMEQAFGATVDGGGVVLNSPMIQTQVAVVAPGPTNTLTGPSACEDLAGTCTSSLDLLLAPAGTQLELESCGMRVVHAGALIRKMGEAI